MLTGSRFHGDVEGWRSRCEEEDAGSQGRMTWNRLHEPSRVRWPRGQKSTDSPLSEGSFRRKQDSGEGKQFNKADKLIMDFCACIYLQF